MNVYIGLPAYNEERSIKPLFKRIEKLTKKTPLSTCVMVYDDGCKDNTKSEVMSWASKLNIIYIDGIVNKGLGTGMNALLSEFNKRATNDDVLVVMDCDDTHDPEQINEMIDVLNHNIKTDIVVASRYRFGATISGVPVHRILLSIGAAFLYKAVHPIWRARDYTCGYRAYRRQIVSNAYQKFGTPIIQEKGFACMVEVLLKLARSGAVVREIPLKLAYDNKLSASKMDVSGNAFRLLKKLITWRVKGLK